MVFHLRRYPLLHLVQLVCRNVVITGRPLKEKEVLTINCGGETFIDGPITVKLDLSSSVFGFDVHQLKLVPSITTFHVGIPESGSSDIS